MDGVIDIHRVDANGIEGEHDACECACARQEQANRAADFCNAGEYDNHYRVRDRARHKRDKEVRAYQMHEADKDKDRGDRESCDVGASGASVALHGPHHHPFVDRYTAGPSRLQAQTSYQGLAKTGF
jgi:hypothetical protein